jgi:hypothetical protein
MLQRRSPLKRTGFARKAPAPYQRPERPPLPAYTLARPCAAARIEPTARPVPKREYIRSASLREAYRLIPCQHCGIDDGTVCCAHSNHAEHGKGKSIKASDDCAASLCFTCHSMLDQGSRLTRAERAAMFLAARMKTVALLVLLGHWPDDIPVPTI